MTNILLLQNFAADAFNARLARANLVTKADFDNTISSVDSKTAENKTKKSLWKINLKT